MLHQQLGIFLLILLCFPSLTFLQIPLFMSSFSSTYLDIEYLAEPRIVAGNWRRGVMPFELQRGYMALLDEAVSRRCRFWLINLSERASGLSAADLQWILEEFFPLLPFRLRRPVYIAYLMAPHQLATSLSMPGMPDLTYFDSRPYRIERFTTQQEALDWLTLCRQQDARARRRKTA